MDMIIITVIAFFVARHLVRSMEPTHYKHKTKQPLSIGEYDYYVSNGECVEGFEPCVSILGFLIKVEKNNG